MTRTERSAYPKAMIKDRSESRSGLSKSDKKNGAGPHNWGRLADERDLEFAALEDEGIEFGKNEEETIVEVIDVEKPGMTRTPSDDEIASAKKFRKHAMKNGEVDLAAIARTSAAVSSSPPN